MPRVLVTLVAAIGFGSGALVTAQDWPEFRGPTGQGIVAQGKLPTEWSATRNVAWKQPIPGTGWSSPIIGKGRIYLTTAVSVKEGRKEDYSLRALCLDAKNGKILWDRELFQQDGAKTDVIHEKASHANPTPITDGQRVYVHFGPHGTAALDLEGKVLWRITDLKYRPWHGNGGSPIVVDDLLIFNCDGEEVQYVVALDRATGKVAWKTDRKVEAEYKNSYCTPLLIEVKGQRQIVSPGAAAVMAYEPKTGKELWRVKLEDGYSNVPRPVTGHGLVFLSNSTDTPHLMAIRPDGKGDVTNSHVAWTQKKAVPLTSSPLLAGDELYMISDAGIATCLDARTGHVHWRERISGNYSASPLLADGKVYFQNEEGVGTVIKTGTKFEVIARNNIGERVMASYAVSDGALFIRTEGHLFRIEAR